MKTIPTSRLIAGVLCASALTLFSSCVPKRPGTDITPADIETTLLLIGDAGEPDPRHSGVALDSLTAQAAADPARTIIVFLGDNVYPDGIPHDSSSTWADARRRLMSQVNAVPRGAKGIFIPGNHDWARAGPFGLYSVRLQERMIASLAQGRDVRMMPGNGCPGPATLDIGRMRLIVMDTQWWLHDFIVRDERSACRGDVGGVTAALREQVQTVAEGRIAIATGHHPLMTGGPHGGYCGLTGPFQRLGGRSQDIVSPRNRSMRDSLESAFLAKPPLVYAAGHDHNLQVMKGTPSVQYLLVSGAGAEAKAECAVYLRESYYVSQHRSGFMRIDILKGKGVLLNVFDYSGRGTRGSPFSRWLEPRS